MLDCAGPAGASRSGAREDGGGGNRTGETFLPQNGAAVVARQAPHAVQPVQRAPAVGVYRFWRDSSFVAGALISGIVADTRGPGEAIAVVAALTGASGIWVAATRSAPEDPRLSAGPMADIGNRV